MSSKKFETNLPILNLPYNIGICTNIVHIPTFANLYTPYLYGLIPSHMFWGTFFNIKLLLQYNAAFLIFNIVKRFLMLLLRYWIYKHGKHLYLPFQ